MPRHAFSRLDVIVVLVIVFTFLGFLLVFLPRQRERGLRVQCMNNLKALGEGIHSFHKDHDFLPPARIADGYATWAVLLAPYVTREHPLQTWELPKAFVDQDEKVRKALSPLFFCPARQRPAAVREDGALGDYAAVAGNGDPARPWTGPDANGPLIVGEVLEKRNNLALKWRGRTSFTSLTRGLSYTLLAGDKHVPAGSLGEVAGGDGSLYDGRYPASFSRIVGPGFALAPSPDSPMTDNFGSSHADLCQFLVADGSVRGFDAATNPEILGRLATRD